MGEYREIENNEPVNAEFVMRLGVKTLLHPFEYARVLMQIGYEPIAPMPSKSLLGRDILRLPNIFQCIGYIGRMDGFCGCYRGVTPKILGLILSHRLSNKFASYIGARNPDVALKECDMQTDEELYMDFKVGIKRQLTVIITGTIIAHPFHVVSLRMMAQFVGKETIYTSIFGSIKEIFQTDGVLGFFAGLVPKLLFEVGYVLLTSSTCYFANKYMSRDKVSRIYHSTVAQFTMGSLLYPLEVVSTCTAISNIKLIAGRPPMMPIYYSWVDCFNDLHYRGELKRGSNIFWRTMPMRSSNNGGLIPMPKVSLLNVSF